MKHSFHLSPSIVDVIDAIAIGINVLLSVLTVLCAYANQIDPRVLPAAGIATMCFPYMLLLSLLWLVGELAFRRRQIVIIGVAMIACIPATHVYAPFNATTDVGDDAKTFTVMTFNCLGMNDASAPDTIASPNPTLQAIIDQDPDVVCLQEIYRRFFTVNWRQGITPEQMDTIYDRYPYRLSDPFPNPPVALMVLSKYPITRDLESNIMTDTGIYTVYRLSIDGHLLTLINVHLQSIGLTAADKQLYRDITKGGINSTSDVEEVRSQLFSKLYHSFAARANQADTLSALIDRHANGNIVLAGDFNDVPGCYTVRTLQQTGLRDAYADAGFGPSITYHLDKFYFRIDHILYHGDLLPVKTESLKIGLSDHYPVMTTFAWTD